MNAISPAPVNSDLYFHEMHKLDKDPESKASYGGGGGGGNVGKLERDGCGEVTWVNKQPVDRGGDGEMDDGGTS